MTAPDPNWKCEARVPEPPWYLHTHECSNTGNREVNGRWLCGVHANAAERRARLFGTTK